MNIADLKDGMRKVDVAGTITDKSETREVKSRYTNGFCKVFGCLTFSNWLSKIG